MVQGTPDTLEGVQEALRKNNIPTSFIDKASSIAMPIAKMKGLNVDELSKSVNAIKNNNNSNNSNSNNQNRVSKYPKL